MVYELSKQGVILRVRLTPNSSSCLIKGIFENAEGVAFLKITVISVPEKGKANKELLALLAKKLKLAKSDLEIVSGETDRYKKILITAPAERVLPLIEALAGENKDERCTDY